MPKVSFRMASASRESVFSVQTSTARKIIGQAHRGPVDHDAKQMLRTERNRCRHTVAWSPSREHWPRAVCRNTGSVMCAGEGTTTGSAPRPCAGVGEALPAGLRRSCPGPHAQRNEIHRTTTGSLALALEGGKTRAERFQAAMSAEEKVQQEQEA